jgi:hypothetical protein
MRCRHKPARSGDTQSRADTSLYRETPSSRSYSDRVVKGAAGNSQRASRFSPACPQRRRSGSLQAWAAPPPPAPRIEQAVAANWSPFPWLMCGIVLLKQAGAAFEPKCGPARASCIACTCVLRHTPLGRSCPHKLAMHCEVRADP